MASVLKVHPSDELIVALADLPAGEKISHGETQVVLQEDIPAKHKFAARDFAEGETVRMYGLTVGRATRFIPQGSLISTENLRHATDTVEIRTTAYSWSPPDVSRWQHSSFMGYHRPDGQVGVANLWLVIPLVFCENRNVNAIRQALLGELGYEQPDRYTLGVRQLIQLHRTGADADQLLNTDLAFEELQPPQQLFRHVDGIRFLTHEGGCGGTRQDSQALINLLAGYITHPNVAGATVLSLGCQHAQIPLLQEAINRLDSGFSKPLFLLEQQHSQSEPAFLAEAIKKTFAGLAEANTARRKPAPLSKLIVGLECGGSDGFSGISANPAVGQASDILVALGGSSILSEFPELAGVEQNLVDRCADPSTAQRFMELMRSYQQAAQAVGSGFEANPSPGNIRDGLITDAIKSAGAARKGGTAPVSDVLDYGEPVKKAGLNLLCTPGNDVESTTALAGSGAQIILFTTGLGTPTGNPVAPVIKISTNSALARRMPDLIDIDAGSIITGQDSIESKGAEIFETLIRVANGEVVPHAVRLGQHDFIPWKRGVSL